MKQNISFDTAKNLVVNSVKNITRKEMVDVRESLNRILAENVVSKYDVPNYDNSAMDGYAVRSKDTKNATQNKPVKLKIVGCLQAGKISRYKISAGECVSVMTGSCIPDGGDAVVEKEKVIVENGYIKIFSPIEKFRNIRFHGEDVKQGEIVVEQGEIITPQILGMIISCGYKKIKVYSKPKVGIISTGDELVEVGEKISFGQVYDVNSYTLSGLVNKYSCDYINFGIARDNYKEITTKLKAALNKCDLVLVSGGVSKGDYDFVKPVLINLNVKPIFWQVKQRPGKPVFFGIYNHGRRQVPVFGIPGNVVSNFVVFEMLVKPLLFKLSGRKYTDVYYNAVFEEKTRIEKKVGVKLFLRGVVKYRKGGFYVKTTGPQGSGMLKSLVKANCIIVVDEQIASLNCGDIVKIKFI